MDNDDNVFSPGDAGSSGSAATRNHDPAPVDIMAIFQRAWQLMMDNLAVVAIGIVLMFAVSMGAQFIAVPIQIFVETSDDQTTVLLGTAARIVVLVIASIGQMFFQIGLLKALIDLDRGADAEVSTLWSQGGSFLWAIVGAFIVGFAAMLGFILLIVPGVIISLGLSMTLLIILDERTDAITAIQESWELTDGHKGFLFLQALAMFGITLAIYIVTCCFGAPVAVGLMAAVQAVTYNALKGAR